MMDNCCAPQWADLTRSPQVLSDDYFEIEHEVHGPQIHFKPNLKLSLPLPCKKENVTEMSIAETNFDDSLEPVQNVCTNVAYFIPHDNKKQSVEEVNIENDLNNAMKNLKLNKKINNIHKTWNISITELTSAFKKSMVDHKLKATVPEKIRKSTPMSETKNVVLSKSLKNNQTANDIKKKDNTQWITLTKDKNESLINPKVDDCPEYVEGNISEKRLFSKIVPVQRKQFNIFKAKQRSLSKSHPKVLTCQYRRRSLMKYRRCSNQFISMAEAISKFQNGTPQRFRTISNKSLKPGPLMKLKRSPLKLTHPVSPPLRCKQRIRHTTILSQQERENLELEKMKKHQVKANPVPTDILKAPCVLKKITKKPVTVTEEFRLTQIKKTRHTTGTHVNVQHTMNDKGHNHKSFVPITRSTSASNIKKENACTELPGNNLKPIVNTFSANFVARNKEFQIRKEEKLKNLHVQETNKIKSEFHARPAPKFSKSTNVVKEQSTKKRIVSCPFSFAERDKSLAKKKEELVKQLQEKSKKIPAFHANPVPNFKSVMVHGLSKENMQSKEKLVSSSKELASIQTKNYNDQENKQPNIIAKKEIKQYVNEPDKKQFKNTMNVVNVKSEKPKINQKNIKLKFELNTDKRAKERNEFDEKIKKKEQEQEAKRQEEEKNKLLKEKMERAELRKLTEMKARPMPIYKPLVVVKSTKLPTSPQSPLWASRSKPKSVP